MLLTLVGYEPLMSIGANPDFLHIPPLVIRLTFNTAETILYFMAIIASFSTSSLPQLSLRTHRPPKLPIAEYNEP